jgi:hypothetical protein
MQTRDIMSPPGHQANMVIPEEILKRLRASSSMLGLQNNKAKDSAKSSTLMSNSSVDSQNAGY